MPERGRVKLEAGASRRLRVFFLGAREEVVRQLAESCGSTYPALVVAGVQIRAFDRIPPRLLLLRGGARLKRYFQQRVQV